MEYPVLAIEPRGFTQLLQSEEYWASLYSGFVGLFEKRVDRMTFYSKNGEKWKLVSIKRAEKIGFLTRLFQPSRRVRVSVEFQPEGTYAVEELRAAFKSAVEADDDILAQHYSHEQIYTWLQDAESIAKLFNLYKWIRKDFSNNPKSREDAEQAAQERRARKNARAS